MGWSSRAISPRAVVKMHHGVRGRRAIGAGTGIGRNHSLGVNRVVRVPHSSSSSTFSGGWRSLLVLLLRVLLVRLLRRRGRGWRSVMSLGRSRSTSERLGCPISLLIRPHLLLLSRAGLSGKRRSGTTKGLPVLTRRIWIRRLGRRVDVGDSTAPRIGPLAWTTRATVVHRLGGLMRRLA